MIFGLKYVSSSPAPTYFTLFQTNTEKSTGNRETSKNRQSKQKEKHIACLPNNSLSLVLHTPKLTGFLKDVYTCIP